MAATVRIVPVTDAPWADVERVFGTRGDPSTCWCQFFKLAPSAWKTLTARACRDALEEQAQTAGTGAAHPPGVIAYLESDERDPTSSGDGTSVSDEGELAASTASEPVGWCAVEPRSAYERLRSAEVVKGSSE